MSGDDRSTRRRRTSSKRAEERQKKGARRGRRDSEAAGEREHASGLAEWTKSILVAVVLFLVIRSFLLQTFVIISGSMEETLLVGDMLVVNRAAFGSRIPLTGLRIPGYSEPRRGDIVIFEPPPPDTVNVKLVKRLIGMPGDTLEMRNRVLYLDGKPQPEPYVTHSDVPNETHPWMEWQKAVLSPGVDPQSYAPTRDDWGPLVVPAGMYFMMGDNREASFDSRYWGLVDRPRIEGRLSFIYFSYNKGSYRPFPWLREIRWGRIGSAGG